MSTPVIPKSNNRSALLGAAFLMATSAIGPGFLTQTAVFTEKQGANFAAVILLSILIDIGAQVNVWRIIAVSGRRAQDIATMIVPGLGWVLTTAIVIGGIAFNVGNVAGAGLALSSVLLLTPLEAAITSAMIGIGLFLVKEAGQAMDKFAQWLGFLMIGLMFYVAWVSSPPILLAMQKAVMPDKIDFFSLVTIVGGTVGGYITFAGGHRLLDAGIKGQEQLPQVTKSAVTGIIVTSIMRILLFTAALGVVSAGAILHASNPPASVFYNAAGVLGVNFFAIVMWSAAITSVVGSAYTSVSFLRSLIPFVEANQKITIVGFITLSTTIFAIVGKPITLLLLAGAINGFILPLALTVMLIAAYKSTIVGTYKHPWWLTMFGVMVIIMMLGSSIYALLKK